MMPVNGMDAPAKPVWIKVGASEYQIQWGPLTEYVLSSRGITTAAIIEKINKGDPHTTALMVEMLAAFTAHSFRSGAAPDVKEWAARLLPGQLQDAFAAMRDMLIEAKVWRSLSPKNVPAPTPEPPTQDQAPKA
jgi:hypothetical protein